MGRFLISRTAPHRTTVAELAGPAGSGKTTLAAHIMRIDGGIGPGRLHIPLHRWVLDACRLLPTFAVMSDAAAKARRHEMKRMLYLAAMSHAVDRARRSGVYEALLLDEGPVYVLARMRMLGGAAADASERGEWLQHALAWWSHALDSVVLLDAPNAVLVRRIRERRDPPPAALADPELSGFLTRYRAVYEQIVGELAAAGPIRVVRIATDGAAPDALARRIHGLLCPTTSLV
jgi:thymidylate kinase